MPPETELPSLTLHQAGAVSPHQLRDEILQHANIRIEKAKISRLESTDSQVTLWQDQQKIAITDHAIVCCAKQSAELIENYPVLKPIRGQVSWVENSQRL
jgi:tRNA 5-methylaminomethyl-2-thiouridine biosynthesis bifunctional protein